MRIVSGFGALLATLLSISAAGAATIIPVVPVPGSIWTFVEGINDNNVIAGFYGTPDGVHHGFYGTLDGRYTTFDFDPVNAPGTLVRGIDNQGDLIGTANVENSQSLLDEVEFERFADGSMKQITNAHAPVHGVGGGIDPHGTFTAENWHEDNTVDGFWGKHARAKHLIDLGFTTTRLRPRAINKDGAIAGYFRMTALPYEGFLLENGVTTVINYPDPNLDETLVEGVNSKGTVSGFWVALTGEEFAFTYNAPSATFTPITVPGFANSEAYSVNDEGLIALTGYSADFSTFAPFVYCPRPANRCPAGGMEIADGKPVHALIGGLPRRAGPDRTQPLNRRHAVPLLWQ
jgi:hypothetical protein